jgi:translation initiation factor 1 (eIF-1/SUI1)
METTKERNGEQHMAQERKKTIRLEWQGSLADNTPESATRVVIKNVDAEKQQNNSGTCNSGNNKSSVAAKVNAATPQNLRIRREAKGRGGHPVFILHEITPVISAATLKDFATKLKTKLGCGGTIEDGQIILQTQNIVALENALVSLKVTSKRCGGF